jgi:hypothetical protein
VELREVNKPQLELNGAMMLEQVNQFRNSSISFAVKSLTQGSIFFPTRANASALTRRDFQPTNNSARPSSASHLIEARFQNYDTEWHLAQQDEARARKASLVITPVMQHEEAPRDESHLRKVNRFMRTRAIKDGSRRPQN